MRLLFRGTMINNGSTLMNDIDLRRYYYIERNHSTSMAVASDLAESQHQTSHQPSSNVSPQYDRLLNEDHMGATTTGMTYINRTLLSPRSQQIMQYLVTMLLVFLFQWFSKLFDCFSVHKKSELYLSVTSVEDNGTFTCVASNRAGSATANFTLHVVIPMPPKPPQASTQI